MSLLRHKSFLIVPDTMCRLSSVSQLSCLSFTRKEATPTQCSTVSTGTHILSAYLLLVHVSTAPEIQVLKDFFKSTFLKSPAEIQIHPFTTKNFASVA